jgi:hypothetical protein
MNAFSVILQDKPIILIMRLSNLKELNEGEVKILSLCSNCKAIVSNMLIIISPLFEKDSDVLKVFTKNHSIIFELMVLNKLLFIKSDFLYAKPHKHQKYTPCNAINFMLSNNYQIYSLDEFTGIWQNRCY